MRDKRKNIAFDIQIYNLFKHDKMNANQAYDKLIEMNVKVSRYLVYDRWKRYVRGTFNPYDDYDITLHAISDEDLEDAFNPILFEMERENNEQ